MPTIGDRMVAKSTVLSFALRQAVCECKVYVARGQELMLVAVAQGTIVKVDTDVRTVSRGRSSSTSTVRPTCCSCRTSISPRRVRTNCSSACMPRR
jgi:hypothetical protein